MKHSAEMQRCIRECDVPTIMKLWQHIAPDMPQPENGYQAAAQIHIARTGMPGMPIARRLYSHAWLRDEGMAAASNLPDYLKARVDRIYPVGTRAVGISIIERRGAERAKALQNVMSTVVSEMVADGIENPNLIKKQMMEARSRFVNSN